MLVLVTLSLLALAASPAPCFHPDVQKCMDERDAPALKKMDACAQNAHWKASVCRSLYEDPKKAQGCIDDRSYVPRAVREGVE